MSEEVINLNLRVARALKSTNGRPQWGFSSLQRHALRYAKQIELYVRIHGKMPEKKKHWSETAQFIPWRPQ